MTAPEGRQGSRAGRCAHAHDAAVEAARGPRGGVGRSLASRCGLAGGLEVELRHGLEEATREHVVEGLSVGVRGLGCDRRSMGAERRHGRRQSSKVDAGSSGPPATRGPGVHPGGSRPLTIATPILTVRSPRAAPSPKIATPAPSSAPRMAFAWAGLRASPDSNLFTVIRPTPAAAANSACVQPTRARALLQWAGWNSTSSAILVVKSRARTLPSSMKWYILLSYEHKGPQR